MERRIGTIFHFIGTVTDSSHSHCHCGSLALLDPKIPNSENNISVNFSDFACVSVLPSLRLLRGPPLPAWWGGGANQIHADDV
jgi:hypothetical protein